MKILPQKKEIDRAKAQEKKMQIDEGMALAKSVDALREQLSVEKKNLLEWREGNLKVARAEIANLTQEQDKLKSENLELREERRKLLEPLDREWIEVNKTKAQQVQEKQNIFLLREQQKEERKLLDNEQAKIKKIATEIGQKYNETVRAKQEALSLKEMAHREYEIAREERIAQTDTHERALLSVHQREQEYEVALKTIEVREQEVQDKEAELITRENYLRTQQVALRIAREVA